MTTTNEAESSPVNVCLEWNEVKDGATHEAVSRIVDEEFRPYLWRIDYLAQDQYSIADTSERLREAEPVDFPTLESAMNFCQEREDKLTSASPKKDAASNPPAIEKKPFDIVQGVESYIAKALEDAGNEEETITAKVLRQRNAVARLSIAMLRMDQGKKTIKERYEEAVEELDMMEKDAARDVKEAEAKKFQPDLPFGENTANPDSPDPRLLIRLDTLKIKPALLAKLAEHAPPLITVGDIASWCGQRSNDHGGNNELTDVNGVGEGKATEIQAALDLVWFEPSSQVKAAVSKLAEVVVSSGATITMSTAESSATMDEAAAKRILNR